MFDRKNLDSLIDKFERTYDEILARVKGLSPEAWQKQNRYNESDGFAALNIAISLSAEAQP